MKKLIMITLLTLLPLGAFAGDGMIKQESAHDVGTTADRLESILQQKGMTVFNRISHSAGAKKVGLDLRPTEVVIFGNPKVGSPLMQCSQSVAIDLPQKALIWEDKNGKTWVSYNDPSYLKKRHAIEGCEKVLAKISKALANFTKAATQN